MLPPLKAFVLPKIAQAAALKQAAPHDAPGCVRTSESLYNSGSHDRMQIELHPATSRSVPQHNIITILSKQKL